MEYIKEGLNNALLRAIDATRSDSFYNLINTIINYCINNEYIKISYSDKYINIYTKQEYINDNNTEDVYASILLKKLIENDYIGVVINPGINDFEINKEYIIQGIIGPIERFNIERKDWGKGIPEYTEEDLITDKELLDFASETIGMYCVKVGYKPICYTNDINAIPNVYIKINDKLCFVHIEVKIAPEMPKLTNEVRNKLIEIANKYDVDIYYAPVGFGSCDKERFDASLALKGDGYYCNFVGLEKIER